MATIELPLLRSHFLSELPKWIAQGHLLIKTVLVLEAADEVSSYIRADAASAAASLELHTLAAFDVASLPSEKYTVIVVNSEAAGPRISHASWLPQLLKSLQQGGSIVILQRSGLNAPVIAELTLSGFIEGAPLENSLQLQGTDYTLVCAKRPLWEIGAKASLKRKVAPPAADKPAALVSTWSVASGKGTDDLVDEDALLDADESPVKGSSATAGASCAPKKRACKNCSCGRKEEEEAAQPAVTVGATSEDLSKKASACGNCYKGDAFRCGSCPFLGKPAFRPGEENTILLDVSASDF